MIVPIDILCDLARWVVAACPCQTDDDPDVERCQAAIDARLKYERCKIDATELRQFWIQGGDAPSTPGDCIEMACSVICWPDCYNMERAHTVGFFLGLLAESLDGIER